MPTYSFIPVNLKEEKKKFFFDPGYNPQFIYETAIPEDIVYGKYEEFGGEFAAKAKGIIDAVIAKWGTESAYLDAVEGRILTKEETITYINEYLKKCGLENKVQLKFSELYIPRTKVENYTLQIRLPIIYREKSLQGVLDHEIGTHIFRRINDERQVWNQKRKDFGLSSYLETEEGIALIHGHLNSEQSYLWITALQYYACFLAATESFVQVYQHLKPYIDDLEHRWNVTIRAKRGISDTSKPGGFTKDQVYLRGAMKVASWLKKNNFEMQRLYIGKISLEDLAKVEMIQNRPELILPPFMLEDQKDYVARLKRIIKENDF